MTASAQPTGRTQATEDDNLVIDMLDTSPASGSVEHQTTTHNAPALQQSRELAAPPVAGPMAGALAFLNAGGKVEQLEQMMALQDRWEAGEARKAYTDAMAEFKRNPPEILKDKRVYFESTKGGTATDYWHATLGNVNQAIVEGLAKVGISHSWKPERKGDRVHVTCTLTHAKGHSESIELDGPLDNSGNKNNIQQVASTTTYLSRYTLLMITGLAVKDEVIPDDDGARGGAADLFAGIPQELAQRARDASMEGWKALAAFTKKITEAERNLLIPVSASLKDAALAVDAAAKEAK